MGFKQRERKRRKRGAIAAAQRSARANGSASSKWWLTLVSTTTCCATCGGVLRTGRRMVYRHTPREARCLPCADGLNYRPSVKWQKAGAGR
jgi:hypothetical protein